MSDTIFSRICYVVGGGALLASGLLRKTPAGIALAAIGGGIAACGLKPEATRSGESGQASTFQKTVTVTKSPLDAYAYWRNLENLPSFIEGLHAVEPAGENRYSWKVRGRLGLPVEWHTEIVNDQPGHLLAWRSVPGSPVVSSGTVRFKKKQNGRGTKIHVQFSYTPASGFSGSQVNRAFLTESGEPKLADNLKNLKEKLS